MVGNHSQHHRHSIIIIFFESTLPKVSIAHQNLQELTEESTPETPGRDSKFPVTQREKSTAWGRINEPHSLYKVKISFSYFSVPLHSSKPTHLYHCIVHVTSRKTNCLRDLFPYWHHHGEPPGTLVTAHFLPDSLLTICCLFIFLSVISEEVA